jgi:hypothetical protein
LFGRFSSINLTRNQRLGGSSVYECTTIEASLRSTLGGGVLATVGMGDGCHDAEGEGVGAKVTVGEGVASPLQSMNTGPKLVVLLWLEYPSTMGADAPLRDTRM